MPKDPVMAKWVFHEDDQSVQRDEASSLLSFVYNHMIFMSTGAQVLGWQSSHECATLTCENPWLVLILSFIVAT